MKDYIFKTFTGLRKPITLEACIGTNLYTKEYGILTDFESGCWAAVLGHSHPEVIEDMMKYTSRLFHTHQYFDTSYPSMLTEIIISSSGLIHDYKGTYLSSGSEAVSLAIALAERITGRKKKLSFHISYLSSLPEMKIPRNKENWLDLDIIDCINCRSNCSECPKFINQDFSEIAAFVFEPGNSGGLVLLPPDQLITFLVEKVRDAGGLIIANEVTTGFGRTGKWFGFQHYDLLNRLNGPDFISMGKGLGNGYPVSGLLIRRELADAVEKTNFRHVQSHTNDPLGCIVAKKVVEILTNENLIAKGAETGEYFRASLEGVKQRTDGIKEIRGVGLMNAILLKDSIKALEVFEALIEKGFFVGFSEEANLLRFYAPLTISRDKIDALMEALESCLLITAEEYKVHRTVGFHDDKQVTNLLNKTYWAAERTAETVSLSLKNSLCYSVYDQRNSNKLIGFGRVVTDYSTMYWLCDVVVDESFRGLGIGKKIMESISSDPRLDGLKGILATRDAFGLYEKFGFQKDPVKFMGKPRTRN